MAEEQRTVNHGSSCGIERIVLVERCGSQVPQYSAFFGFDFAGGGLDYYDMNVFEVHELVQGIGREGGCFPDFAFRSRNQEILDAIDQSSRSGAWVSTQSISSAG